MTETTVTLNGGEGSTKYILPYLVGNHEGPEDNPTSISNWRITKSRIYQFHFVEASESASIPDTGNLPERVEYKLGDTVATPLEVKVSAPEGSDIIIHLVSGCNGDDDYDGHRRRKYCNIYPRRPRTQV